MWITVSRPRQAAFSLPELMTAVAIIGILAAAALPQYVSYIRRAKSAEAAVNVRKIFDAAVTYHTSDHADPVGTMLPRQWPVAVVLTPVLGTCCSSPGQKCSPNPVWWGTPTWEALRFKIDDSHYYSYQFITAGIGTSVGQSFQAQARGDLDCDTIYSTFNRTGVVVTGHSVQGGSGLYVALDIE